MKSGCCPSRSLSAFSRIVLANPVKKKLKVFLFSPLGQSTHQASISSTWRRGMYILQLTGQQNDMMIVGPVMGLYVGKVGYTWKPESLGSSFHFTGSPWGSGPNTATKCANFKGCHKKNRNSVDLSFGWCPNLAPKVWSLSPIFFPQKPPNQLQNTTQN